MTTATHNGENERLEALRAYAILDTPPEANFEHITSMVARLFGVSIAAVSLIDADRQWFKSVRGIEIREIPREHSFCAHTMWGHDVMVVPDTTLDPRFAHNPFVTGPPGVRFYAGAPLRTPEGHPLGALCVIDFAPRQFGPAEQLTLAEMAVLVQDELLLRRAGEELKAKTLELESLKSTLAEKRGIDAKSPSELQESSGSITKIPVGPSRRPAPDSNTTQIASDQDGFRYLVEHANDALFVYDLEGRFVEANLAASKLVGYDREELLSLRLADIEISFDAVTGPDRWREMVVGEAVSMEGLGRRKDGSVFSAEARVSVVETPVGRYILALVRDTTERKRAESLLQARAQQQQALARIGADALSGRDTNALVDGALRLVRDTLGLELSRVLEHVPEHAGFVIRAGLNLLEENRGAHSVSDATCYAAGYVFSTGEPVLIRNFDTETRFRRTPWLESEKVICGLCVPIGGDGSGSPRYGILGAYSRVPREFSEEEMHFVHSVANVLAAAIARRRGEDELRVVQARYQRIAANTSGLVFQLVMKPDYSVTIPFISEGCRLVYEREPAEMQANPQIIHRSVHPEDKEYYKQVLRASVASLKPFDWEGRVLLRSGTIRWVTARARLDKQPSGEVIWDGVVLDVTELKLAQQAMFNAKEEAERANAAKSEFLSRMSHELRTPLNAILGFGQVLQLSQLDEQDGQCVEYILKGGQHLLSLVDEVLDLSRVETGDLALRPAAIAFGQLVEECTGFLAKLAQARGITCTTVLSPDFGIPVWADAQRLRQVLINLISNAIKYNREHGRVELSCEQMPGGRVRCNIKDTGSGISRDNLERLFVPFERLGQELGTTEGTGLGLAVSKRLVEAMDGAVGAVSEPDVGSTFWVEIPSALAATGVQAATSPSASVPAVEAKRPPSVRVLYVEDNASNLQVLKAITQRLRPGWRLLSATDGISGLQRIREEHPDIVLLDLALPGKHGDAVLAELRADPSTVNLPVIVLSADATAQSRERLLSLGANDYVSKPFNVTDLLAKLDATLLALGGRR